MTSSASSTSTASLKLGATESSSGFTTPARKHKASLSLEELHQRREQQEKANEERDEKIAALERQVVELKKAVDSAQALIHLGSLANYLLPVRH